MFIEHINRKDEKYYLCEGVTKKGNKKYHFSKNKPETSKSVKNIPDGFEIYENPNGQVFLRKILPKIINDKEIALVVNEMQELLPSDYFKVDVKKNDIVVFFIDQHIEEIKAIFMQFKKEEAADALIRCFLTYSPQIQFSLIDEKKRIFDIKRWNYRNDDWMMLEYGKSLKYLVKKYCKHVGKESFYELI